MSIKDIRSNLQQNIAATVAVSGNGTTNGDIIDTANFELGTMFTVIANNYTDGTYNFTLEEDDVIGFGTATAITDADDSDRLIGTLAGLTLTAADAGGAKLNTFGVIGTKRFIRLNVVATSVSTGADIVAVITQKGEVLPV